VWDSEDNPLNINCYGNTSLSLAPHTPEQDTADQSIITIIKDIMEATDDEK
jgi:hypothetical protein